MYIAINRTIVAMVRLKREVAEMVKNNTPYFPCGAIANSMFSDMISLKFENNEVEVIRTGIAWDSDKRLKFKNPSDCLSKGNGTNECLKLKFKDFAKPIDW